MVSICMCAGQQTNYAQGHGSTHTSIEPHQSATRPVAFDLIFNTEEDNISDHF